MSATDQGAGGGGGGVSDVEAVLLATLRTHRYALGYDGILADGEVAWLECVCGWKQNVEMEQDDIRIAEARWDRHIAAMQAQALTAEVTP